MSLDFPHAGETYSLLSAVVWAVAVILFRKSGDVVPPRALNVFKNTLALALVALTMLAVGSRFAPPERTASEWLALLVSGALGLGIADSLVFAGLNRLGASRFAVVDCSFTPWIFLCSSLYLHEELGVLKLAGAALVGCAVVVGTIETKTPETKEGPEVLERGRLAAGVLFGLSAMLVMAIGVVIAKPVLSLSTVDAWWAIGVRLAGGVLTSALIALACGDRRALGHAFAPGPHWRLMVPASVIGTYFSMCLWILGIKFTQVTISSVLNQTCTFFTLILATVFLGEKLTARRVVAIALGFGGAVLVSLREFLESPR